MAFRRNRKKNKRVEIRTRRRRGRLASSLLFAIGTLTATAAFGQTIQITSGDCRTGVTLVARSAPLIDVLTKLSQALDFELRYEGVAERIVNFNATRQPADLIASLSPQDSIVVTQAKDAKCPQRNRVVKVWVLPSGGPTPKRDALPASASQAPAVVQQPPATREHVMRGADVDKEAQRRKAAYDDYVRQHGVPPPGAEQEEAKQ